MSNKNKDYSKAEEWLVGDKPTEISLFIKIKKIGNRRDKRPFAKGRFCRSACGRFLS